MRAELGQLRKQKTLRPSLEGSPASPGLATSTTLVSRSKTMPRCSESPILLWIGPGLGPGPTLPRPSLGPGLGPGPALQQVLFWCPGPGPALQQVLPWCLDSLCWTDPLATSTTLVPRTPLLMRSKAVRATVRLVPLSSVAFYATCPL